MMCCYGFLVFLLSGLPCLATLPLWPCLGCAGAVLLYSVRPRPRCPASS